MKLGRVALDGAKVKANASRHKAMSYDRMLKDEERLKQEIADLMAQADAADAADDEQFGDCHGDEIPDVIEEILTHCGLWQSPTPRGPPDVDGLVLELDAAYSDSAIDSPDQADESQDLTYVDIDTFLANF